MDRVMNGLSATLAMSIGMLIQAAFLAPCNCQDSTANLGYGAAAASYPVLDPTSQSRFSLLSSLMAGGLSGRAEEPTFIGFEGVDAERRKLIAADTLVLEHLINKGFPANPARTAMGISVNATPVGNETLYIDGTGLILTRHVNWPVAPLQEAESEKPKEKDSLTEWERAKQELAQVQDPRWRYLRSDIPVADASLFAAVDSTGIPGMNNQSYDADFAKQLDQAVSQALRQSGNFRTLNSSDSITVLVYGPGSNENERTAFAWRIKMSDVGDDKSIPESKVERKQYRETLSN